MQIIISPEHLVHFRQCEDLLLDIREELIAKDVLHWKKAFRLNIVKQIEDLLGIPSPDLPTPPTETE